MSQIPHLLIPYLTLPPSDGSLVLLTSVLGASTNWLVLRYLQSLLRPPVSRDAGGKGETSVLLVSFMRDSAFWREGSRKMGLDLDRLATKKRFLYIDGLSSLFLSPAVSSRTPQRDDPSLIQGNDLLRIAAKIKNAIQALKAQGGNVVLVIDQLDLLLATSTGDGKDGITAQGLGEALMELRQDVYTTILTLTADTPLVTTQFTPLEVNHASFLLSTTHQADLVMGLRLLDTGAARDVSGVMRISVSEDEEEKRERGVEDKELLYFVGGDGGVKVFERGS